MRTWPGQPLSETSRRTRSDRWPSRIGDAVVAGRWPLCVLLVLVAALLFRDAPTADMAPFAQAGGSILAGHFGSAYARPFDQSGPLQLLIDRALAVHQDRTPVTHLPSPWLVVEVTVDLSLLAVLRLRCRLSRLRPVTELLLGLAAVAEIGPNGLWAGHPAELVIPLLWWAAAAALARGRWVLGAVALGLGISAAPWAVLAVPMVFAARRRQLVGAVLAVAFGAATYAPFALSGHFALFQQTWPVQPDTLVHLVAPGLATFGWPLRLLQAAVAASGCLVVARRSNPGASAWYAAPLTAVLLRIMLDPVRLPYYWTPVAVLVLCAILVDDRPARRLGCLLGLCYLAYLGRGVPWPWVVALSSLVLLGLAGACETGPEPETVEPASGRLSAVGPARAHRSVFLRWPVRDGRG